MAKHQALADLISRLIRESPRSQRTIATRIGTTEATLSRWAHGSSSPGQDWWPKIEAEFTSLRTGELAAAAYGEPTLPADIAGLPTIVADLLRRVERLEGAAQHPATTQAPQQRPSNVRDLHDASEGRQVTRPRAAEGGKTGNSTKTGRRVARPQPPAIDD